MGKTKTVNETEFFGKIRHFAGKIPFANDVVAMYFSMMDSNTPFHARAAFASAIAYFILPADVVPDAIAIAGFADDAGLIASTLAYAGTYVTNTHYKEAKKVLS